METCTPRPNISIRSAHSVPNLYFEVNSTFESSLKNADAVLNECDEFGSEGAYSKCNGFDINISNNNISSPRGIEIVIPFNDSGDDSFQRNTARKSRKRHRAPPPPASITRKTLPKSKYTLNSDTSVDLLIVKSDNQHIDDHEEDDSGGGQGLGNRSDNVRMSVLQRKDILEKQLKLRVNGLMDEPLHGSHIKSAGSDRKHMVHKENAHESEGEITTKTVDAQKEIKRPFIPPPPPPPSQTPRPQPPQRNESRISNGPNQDDKDEKNGCDTCVDWLLFLLCIA